MKERENLTKKFMMVRMNEVMISTSEKPIIGTQALATCVGVLLYSESNKKAIVSHVASNIDSIILQTLELIDENKLDNEPLKYLIIPGYYYNHSGIQDELDGIFKSFPFLFVPFKENEIPIDFMEVDEKTTSHQFAFDSSTGKFVTGDVLFGSQYYDIVNGESDLKKK